MYISYSILVCCAAMVQAAIGFGFTPIAMAFLPHMMSYSKSIAVSFMIVFLSTFIVAFKYRKYVLWKIMLPLLIPTMLMNIVAAVMSSSVSSQTMYTFLGFMLIAVALFFFCFSKRIHFTPSLTSGLILGSVCGVCYGLFAIGGPTASLYLTTAIDDKDEYMGTMQMFLWINNVLGVVIRLLKGDLSFSDAPMVGLGWIFMFLGTFLGLKLFRKISKDIFSKVIYAFVGLNGLWIVISNLGLLPY